MYGSEPGPLLAFWRDEVQPRLTAELVYGVSSRRQNVSIPCPIHNGRDPNFSVNTHTLVWRCHSQCQVGGDPIKFVQMRDGLADFRDAVLALAGMAGVSTFELERAERERSERRGASYQAPPERPKPAPKPAPPREPEQAHNYPPADDVAALWAACVRVDTDAEAADYLRKRAFDGQPRPIDPVAIADLDAARVIPRGLELPRGARFKGRTWHETGHRLIVPLFDDGGRIRAVMARRVRDGDSPKALPLAGFERGKLVMADALGRMLLATGTRPEWWPENGPTLRVYVCEGDSDYLLTAVGPEVGQRWSEADEYAPAVLGIESGAWTQAIADRLPDGCVVVIATDNDKAGDRYAEQVTSVLGPRYVAGRIGLERWRPKTT